MYSLFFCGDDGAGQPLKLVLGRDRTILGPDEDAAQYLGHAVWKI